MTEILHHRLEYRQGAVESNDIFIIQFTDALAETRLRNCGDLFGDVFRDRVNKALVHPRTLTGSDGVRLHARCTDKGARTYVGHPNLNWPQPLGPQALAMQPDLIS